MTERISFYDVIDNLNTVIEVDRVYPKEDSKKVSIDDLKSIGLQLDEKQALELAGYLVLAVSNGWKKIDITGYRKPKKNGYYKLTVTTEKKKI